LFFRLLQNARCPVRAESRLARPHAQTQIAPQIVQRHRLIAVSGDGFFKLWARDHFAFADQFAGRFSVFQVVQTMIQAVRVRIAGRTSAAVVQVAVAQPRAYHVHHFFGHQAAGQFSTDHRDQAAPSRCW
jgi:hypothetical protein